MNRIAAGLRVVILLVIVVLLSCSAAFAELPTTAPSFNVVGFYNGTYDKAHINFVHEANPYFTKLAEQHGFTYTATTDWHNLNADYLAKMQVVLFLDDSPHDPAERAAFQHYMETGGGWMGFHVCAFTTDAKEWDWYFNQFLGSGNFHDNTWWPTQATLKIDDPNHPAVKGLPNPFTSAVSEWYSWDNPLRQNPDINVLASIDPSCFPLGTDPKQSWYKGDYPILWTNKKFKMIYANFGHNYMDYKADVGKSSTFASEDQNKFILNSLMWLGSR